MEKKIPNHVAIILDGNGRWANEKGKIRIEGHKAGYENIEPICLYAQSLGVNVLSLYCFSTENWNRPKQEVDFLMSIPSLLIKNLDRYEKNNIKIIVSGRKDRAPNNTIEALNKLVNKTKDCSGMTLNICFDYGALYDIKTAIEKIKESDEIIDEKSIFRFLSTSYLPPVDLLIRPGGEKRLSNFLLLESAYAELVFMDVYWPNFGKSDFDLAIDEFSRRNRRYGGIANERS